MRVFTHTHTHTGSICAENGDRREPGDLRRLPYQPGGMPLKPSLPPSGCILLVRDKHCSDTLADGKRDVGNNRVVRHGRNMKELKMRLYAEKSCHCGHTHSLPAGSLCGVRSNTSCGAYLGYSALRFVEIAVDSV